MTDYTTRVVDMQIRSALSTLGAVVIEGPRACGKTATGLHHCASSVLLDSLPDAPEIARLAPREILDGDPPRLIDEWQLAPRLWNLVRHEVDARQQRGQFILTGSATPADDITRHSGAGRFLRVRMRPMSLYELGTSNGSVSLARLMAREPAPSSTAAIDFTGLVETLCVGGWPGLRGLSSSDALAANRSYLRELARVDLPAITGVRRDPRRIGRLLRSLARNSAAPVPVSTLAADVGAPDDPIKPQTIADYLDALLGTYVLEDQDAWSPDLRSRARLRVSPKRHFVDPSLAVAALDASPARLIKDLHTLGLLFESLVIRDLRVYAQHIGAQVLHFRDGTGAEVDAIIELPDGTWAAIEIKLSAERADAAAASLRRVTSKVDTQRAGEPAALLVVTADRYGYMRDDGVAVVPITALGP